MAEQRAQRKLTTILIADVEGYSRLIHAHEEATRETLGDYREIIDRPKFPWQSARQPSSPPAKRGRKIRTLKLHRYRGRVTGDVERA